MNNDINLLGEELKREVYACKEQEDSVRKLEEQYQKAIKELHINNQGRTERLNKIRLAKIAEINDELTKTNSQIKELENQKEAILYTYCEKKGHTNVRVNSEHLGYTGTHSFGRGFETIVRSTYRCVVCGRKSSHTGKTYAHGMGIKPFIRSIPESLYNDTELREDGKSYGMIQEELHNLYEYREYLNSLLEELCSIFGHDAVMTDYNNESFKCNCCGKSMSYQEYINNHHSAIYRGVVPFHYVTLPEGDYTIPSKAKLTLSLQSYDSYKKEKTKENQ